MRLYLLSSTIWHALAQGRAGCRNALPPTGKPAGPHAPAPPGAGSFTRLPGHRLAACSPSGPFSPTSVRRLFPPPPPARHSPRRPRRHLCLEARLLPLARLRPSKGRDPPKQGETRAPARQFEHPVGRGGFPHSSWHRLQSSRNGSSCPGPAAASHTHSAGRTPFGSRFAAHV